MKYRVKRHAVTQPLDTSYRLIPLTKGKNAIVDAEDFEILSQWNWIAQEIPKAGKIIFYACRRNKKRSYVLMHRYIIGCLGRKQADHKNHDTLDNRKTNLRKCSNGQNSMKRKKQPNNTSGFKGVWWNKQAEKWQSELKFKGEKIYLGRFDDPKEAAKAYDEAAKIYYREFAVLNFPHHETPIVSKSEPKS